MDKAHNPVGWFEIYVSDMARAKAFYTAVFGRELVLLPAVVDGLEMYAFSWVEGGAGAAGALVKHPEVCAGKGGTLVYFSCQEVTNEANRAAQAGGKVIQPKMAIGPYGFIALIEDSEGNMLGLHSMQ